MHYQTDEKIAQKFRRLKEAVPDSVLEFMRSSAVEPPLPTSAAPSAFEELVAHFCTGCLYIYDHLGFSPRRIELVDELPEAERIIKLDGIACNPAEHIISITRGHIARALHNQKGNNCSTNGHLPVTFKTGDLWKCIGIESAVRTCAKKDEEAIGSLIRQGAKDLELIPYNPWNPTDLFINKNQKTGFDTRGADILYFQGVLDRHCADKRA